jgi:hypothetical protein
MPSQQYIKKRSARRRYRLRTQNKSVIGWQGMRRRARPTSPEVLKRFADLAGVQTNRATPDDYRRQGYDLLRFERHDPSCYARLYRSRVAEGIGTATPTSNV